MKVHHRATHLKIFYTFQIDPTDFFQGPYGLLDRVSWAAPDMHPEAMEGWPSGAKCKDADSFPQMGERLAGVHTQSLRAHTDPITR